MPAEFEAHRDFSIMHINIQGLLSHCAELVARLRLLRSAPHILCFNETFLDCSVGEVVIEGYACVARRDRRDGRRGGGVAVYALREVSQQVTLLAESVAAERLWLMLHLHQGPHLLCAWYSPPGERDSIHTLQQEWEEHKDHALGSIVVGDLNVHQANWLRHSSRNSPEGAELHQICCDMGMKQVVETPTRSDYLLDLV